MKRLLLVLLFPLSVLAADVGMDFRNAGVVELAEGVIKGILHRDYVITPDALANGARLTLSVKSLDKAQVLPMLQSVLAGAGIEVTDKEGVLFIAKKDSLPAAAATSLSTSPANATQFPAQYPGQFPPYAGVGQFGQQTQFPGMPAIAPKELAFHRPRGKSVEFLSSVARIGGAYVPDIKGKGDVVVFGGEPEVVARVKVLLDQVDVASPSIQVKAALIEYTQGESSARSLSLALSALAGKLGIAYQAGQALTNGLNWRGANLQAALTAIDGDRRFKYIAEPSLRVMDGESARFVVGSEVPTRAGAIVDKSGNPVQSIEYRTAGVVITVEPKVLQEAIRVKIGQQISSFALTTTSGIDSPTILKREAETTVTAKDGELIVIAGMDETRETDSRDGFSFLPDFLRSKNQESTRSQMLLLVEVQRSTTD